MTALNIAIAWFMGGLGIGAGLMLVGWLLMLWDERTKIPAPGELTLPPWATERPEFRPSLIVLP